jgi:hypothetical protein
MFASRYFTSLIDSSQCILRAFPLVPRSTTLHWQTSHNCFMRSQSSLFLPPMQPDFSWDNSALSCWDSSGSDEALVIMCSAVAAAYHYWNTDLQEDDALASQHASGSRPGKGRNRNRGRTEGALRIDRDYFCRFQENADVPDGPLFTEEEFRLRFRVSLSQPVSAPKADWLAGIST